ncbi:hypothetical protein FB451DRAFT_1185125 [Mycena latifolia]|nr:hypothetical protein FB451DRAFT_1185125 [Mycena latifolia]
MSQKGPAPAEAAPSEKEGVWGKPFPQCVTSCDQSSRRNGFLPKSSLAGLLGSDDHDSRNLLEWFGNVQRHLHDILNLEFSSIVVVRAGQTCKVTLGEETLYFTQTSWKDLWPEEVSQHWSGTMRDTHTSPTNKLRKLRTTANAKHAFVCAATALWPTPHEYKVRDDAVPDLREKEAIGFHGVWRPAVKLRCGSMCGANMRQGKGCSGEFSLYIRCTALLWP